MGERLRVGLLLVALGMPISARAESLDDQLSEVRALIVAGEHKIALKSLKTIEKSLASTEELVNTRSLCRVWLYRGAAEFAAGNKRGRAEDAWRQALAIENDVPWDADLMGESELISLFEALRGEVEGRGYVETGVPEKVGAAKLYVDGQRHTFEDTVIQGSHLAQIECPDDQGTFSVVTDFSRPIDWFSLCPDGVDPSVEVAEEEEDEWAEFGPSFGSTTSSEDPVEDPVEDPITETDPVVTTDPTETDPIIPDPNPDRSGPGPGTYMLASGGALVAGGLVVNFVLVNPIYARIEAANNDPYSISRSDATVLTSQFNSRRYLTIGLTAGGLALVGSSFLIDAPIQPIFGLGQLGVTGQF